MNYIFYLVFPFLIFQDMIVFDFNSSSDLSAWAIVDDVVMGGRSDGQFFINKKGHAQFEGKVSLENNGGFSSARYRFSEKEITGFQKIVIRLKGDGKRYQFRIKANLSDRHSYISYFETTGEWQDVEISLTDLYPTFRGRQLMIPNFAAKQMAEIAFLVGNKKAEVFCLEIDSIVLKTDE